VLTKIKIFLLGSFVILFLVGCSGGKFNKVMEARKEVSSAEAEPNNIVIMLPLHGKYAASGKAVRNGFLSAYYQDRKERSNIKVNVIDTSQGDLTELYQQAVQNGAEVIVGPLTKQDVEKLINIEPLPVPTIALNTLDDYTRNFASNLYQFGLLPQDEASQVAEKMVYDQHNLAAIIVPDDPWGEKIASIFQARYDRSGGNAVAILRYNNSTSLSSQFCHFLAEDPEELCGPRKRKDKTKDQEDVEEKTRRQDIDSIFLVANADAARQIVPLLKFYYAGDLPTYSISSIYSGSSTPMVDRDIDGIYFCDMPWILKDSKFWSSDLPVIQNQVKKLWPNSFASYPRLYALGIDAYNLSSKLNTFLNMPYQQGIDGATGKLYLDNYNHIYRELDWAQVKNGIPQMLEAP